MSNYPQNMDTREQAAWELGADAARAAASWVIDGNLSTEHYARLVTMMADGDPRLDEYLPARPDLSGEWADKTPASLFETVTGFDAHAEASFNGDAYAELVEQLCDAWEAGVSDTFETECERLIRRQLED